MLTHQNKSKGWTTVKLYRHEKEVLKRLAEAEARSQNAEVNFLIVQRARELNLLRKGEEIIVAATRK